MDRQFPSAPEFASRPNNTQATTKPAYLNPNIVLAVPQQNEYSACMESGEHNESRRSSVSFSIHGESLVAANSTQVVTDKQQKEEASDFAEPITKRMNEWIRLLRMVLIIQTISAQLLEYKEQETSPTVSWGGLAYLPDLMVSSMQGVWQSYFILAGFFSMHTAQRLYRSGITRQTFFSNLTFWITKRYFRLVAPLLIFGLGYYGLVLSVFEEAKYRSHALCPSNLQFWLANFFPFYWRRPYEADCIARGAEFTQILINVEFFFFVLYTVLFVVWRKKGIRWYTIIFVLTSAIFIGLFVRYHDKNVIWSAWYLLGIFVYLCRKLTIDFKLTKLMEWCYSTKTCIRVMQCCIQTLLIYLWLSLSRSNQKWAGGVFFAFVLVSDLWCFGNPPQLLVLISKEFCRLSNCIYLVSSFVLINYPKMKMFPYLKNFDPSQADLHPERVNYFYAWVYAFMFGALSYPLWLLQRPIEKMPHFIKLLFWHGLKLERKKVMMADLFFALVLICVNAVFFILTLKNLWPQP